MKTLIVGNERKNVFVPHSYLNENGEWTTINLDGNNWIDDVGWMRGVYSITNLEYQMDDYKLVYVVFKEQDNRSESALYKAKEITLL